MFCNVVDIGRDARCLTLGGADEKICVQRGDLFHYSNA